MANITFSEDDLEPVDFNAPSGDVKVPKSAVESADDEFFSAAPKKATTRKRKSPGADVEVSAPAPVSGVVAKMRSIFGVDRAKLTYVPLYLNEEETPAFTIGLRPANRQDFEWVAKRFNALLQDVDPDDEYTKPSDFLFETLILAIAVSTLDEGPVDPKTATPIWKALEIEPQNEAYVRDPYNPHISIRVQCAEVMFDLLYNSMNHFVVTLNRAYNNSVATISTEKPKPKKPAQGSAENPTTR